MMPRRTVNFPYSDEQAKWQPYDSDPLIEHTNAEESIICCLDHKQRFKFRLRAVDLDNPDNTCGKASAPISFKLPKYGKSPVLPVWNRPTLVILG